MRQTVLYSRPHFFMILNILSAVLILGRIVLYFEHKATFSGIKNFNFYQNESVYLLNSFKYYSLSRTERGILMEWLLWIIGWLIIGAVAGWIASKITGNDSRMGPVANIVVGIIGAFIGGIIMSLLGGSGFTGFNLWSLIVAIVGAVILLWIVNAIRRNH